MEAELCSQYRLQSPVEEHQALVEQVSKADLWGFFDRLSSLQAYLAKLHWFATVNSEAISRIYKRISDIDVLECSGAPLIEVPAACIAECETEIKWTCRLKTFLTSYLESNGLERIGRDGQGHLSLHYGATLGDYEICLSALKRLIDANGTSDDINNALLRCDERKWTPLHIAVIHNHCAILELFLNALKLRAGESRKTDDGSIFSLLENLLIIALKYQHDDMIPMLVSAKPIDNRNILPGTTLLHIAVQTGRINYVALLIDNMDDPKSCIDVCKAARGWTPLILAAASGNLEVVKILLEAGANRTVLDSKGWTAQEHAAFRGHLYTANFLGPCNTLDSLDSYGSKLDRVKIDPLCKDDRKFIIIHLGNNASNPLVFPLTIENSSHVAFNIFHYTNANMVGSGMAFLEDDCLSMTPPCTVSFTCTIAKPYVGTIFRRTQNRSKLSNGVKLVGHRGVGQNTASREYLQLGENTVDSCLSAAALGASFVEVLWYFRRPIPRLTSSVLKHNLVTDVQVTRDLVPVIYYDFSLSELGSDVPIHGVDLAQFLHAGNYAELEKLESRTPRSRSLTREDDSEARSRTRLQHTVDFMGKGYKPNSRGTFIQSPFATLEDLLVQLPKNLGFVLEIKYPRLHEAAEAGVAPMAIELNTYLDAVLDGIYRFGLDRGIILASFTPEVCILLAKKATGFPVFFITNAGKLPITDMEKRGASLQAGFQFARLWNLAGIILAAETFLLCPRLIKYVQMAGLVCASSGLVKQCARKC
ncbi:hypothetical protein LOZ51_000255 [Ophidiomyces ophidiicola]|nr:hypothetical protein LOZ51_000255 [Ophidiomyces ophidiicola]